MMVRLMDTKGERLIPIDQDINALPPYA